MEIGFASTDVTPPVGTPMGGRRTWRFAHGTADPLRATAMALEGDGGALVLCSVDAIWLSDDVVAGVRERVARRTDLDRGAVLVGATHTHSGPAMAPMIYPNAPDPDYERELTERVAGAAVAAVEDRGPARLRAGTADAADLLVNRRAEYRAQREPDPRDDLRYQLEHGQRPGPEDVDDDRVPAEREAVDGGVAVLAAASPDGEALGTFLGFGCHTTTIGGDRYSGDYVGELRADLAASYGAGHETVFGLGACGDVIAADRSGGRPVASDIGGRLAEEAAAVHREGTATEAAVAWTAETLHLPRRTPTEAQLTAARERLDRQSGTENDRALWAAHEALRLADGPDSHAVEVWAAGIGGTALLALPGEVFHEHALAIKRRSPFDRTVTVTLANGYCGYVPTEATFRRGGYEAVLATSSFLQPDAGGRMVGTAVDLLEALA